MDACFGFGGTPVVKMACSNAAVVRAVSAVIALRRPFVVLDPVLGDDRTRLLDASGRLALVEPAAPLRTSAPNLPEAGVARPTIQASAA
jgi:hydroxymethylpyrimidine/phosphomethylpyrimidine kinase